MLLRKTFHKTKMFFHKTLQNLKSFLFGGYQKLPKPRPLNPVYGGNDSNPNLQQLDQLYRDFTEQCQSHNNDDKLMKSKEPMNEADTSSSGSFMKFEERSALKNRHEEREKEKKKKKTGSSGAGKRGEACSQNGNGGGGGGGGYMLAQKMRELEMMDMNDAEHVLDMEEALHHYSRLTCPVYLDLVDTFFMDMYSEFFIPKHSGSITNSSQRLGPLKF